MNSSRLPALLQYLFQLTWGLLCYWTPKPFNPWRLLILRAFGCRIFGTPFVHPHARVTHPWHLTLHPRACLGDGAHAYALGPITLHTGCTVAQEAYLCTGTHRFHDPALPLVTAPIIIQPHAFIGARAFILPGVTVGASAIVGACSVVTRSVAPHTTVAGQPARSLHG